MVDVVVLEEPAQKVAVVRRHVPMSELSAFFTEAFGAVAACVVAAGGVIVGAPFGWYHGMPSDSVDVSAGFPVGGIDKIEAPEVMLVERPGGRSAICTHVGPYDTMGVTYASLEEWMSQQAVVPSVEMWEEYLSEPTGDPSTWQTRIVWPIASPMRS